MATKHSDNVVTVQLELHNYKSADDFFAQNINVDAQLGSGRSKYSVSYNVPVEVELRDLGIDKNADIMFVSGNNTWVDTSYIDKFGLTERQMVNTATFEKMPWTVWLKSGDKYRPKWCGRLFNSDEDAQKWIDEQNTEVDSGGINEE